MPWDELDDDRLWDQYARAVEEYRFQVDLNWRRSQYYFVLTAAVIGAAGALLTASAAVPSIVIVLLFVAGSVIALLAILANRTAKSYYETTRDLKGRLEDRLGLDELAIRTTEGMGGRFSRLGRVTTFQTVMLATLLAASATGAVLAAVRHDPSKRSKRAPSVTVVARATIAGANGVRTTPHVLLLDRGSLGVLQLRPVTRDYFVIAVPIGTYSVILLGRGTCTTRIRVSNAKLQRQTVSCRSARGA